jgi:hypothetical protein
MRRDSVDGDQQEALREQVVQVLLAYSAGPKLVTTRLAQATAMVVLNSVPNDWIGPVKDLAETLPAELFLFVLQVCGYLLFLSADWGIRAFSTGRATVLAFAAPCPPSSSAFSIL